MHNTHRIPKTASRRLVLTVAAALAACVACGSPNPAVADPQEAPPKPAEPVVTDGTTVTVYSSADPTFDPQQFIAQQRMGWNPMAAWQVPGYAVVKTVKPMAIKEGRSELRFTDVAQFIDPTTVSFRDLTDGTTAVLEQNFEFDLVSPSKLLEKYIDRDISHVRYDDKGEVVETFTGKVLSANQGQVVVQSRSGEIRFLSSGDPGIRLGALPDGLITKPTLVWKLDSKTGGEHRVRTTYQTGGMTWRADYNLVLSDGDRKADVGAWVTLLNLSGATFKDAKLKLIAGDVQTVRPQSRRGPFTGAKEAMDTGEAGGFDEKSLFEYHLYTLPRPADILQNATQQIVLFPTARDVAVQKEYVYFGTAETQHWGFGGEPQRERDIRPQSNPKVDVYLHLKNEKANQLGIPLPKGRVRVYSQDSADGNLEFVGEDLIDHTPKDEKVTVRLGNAFDVVGERKQAAFSVESGRRTMTESIEIVVKNHKAEPVTVTVRENLYRWTNWELTAKSDEFTKVDSNTIHFPVTVPADGSKTVTYTVRYTW